MTDFSKMVFEERTIEPGMREIRIVAPCPEDGPPLTDRKLTGTEARKRLIRYVMSNTASMVPEVETEIRRICDYITESIDAETAPDTCQHGIPRHSVSEGCIKCPCPELGDGTHPHDWEDNWCRYCGVQRPDNIGDIQDYVIDEG